jgi:hypothetical protein
MNCTECNGTGKYWTEGNPDTCEDLGLDVINTPDIEFDGTTLIECPHCKLKNRKVGDVFDYNGNTYIAFSLTPDGFEVFCLNLATKELEEIYEGANVQLIESAIITNNNRGKELEVGY